MNAPTITPDAISPTLDSGEPNRIITILSPKGGAGKTSVATNLAVGLAERYPRQVVIVDLDLQFGDVATNLRMAPKATIVDLARSHPFDSAQVKLTLTGHHTGLYALCAPLNPAEADEVSADHVSEVLASLHRSFRYVVIDTDPGLSERVLSALDVSTDIVNVCSTEVPSIRGLRKALDALDVIGLTTPRRLFLLNRSDAKVGVDAHDVERTIGQPVDISLPSSIDMVLATNDGVPVVESGRNPSLTKPFSQLVDLFGPPTAAAAERHGLRLFKRKA